MKQNIKRFILIITALFMLNLAVLPAPCVYAGTTNEKDNSEFQAVWITYLEFSDSGYKEAEFKKHIDNLFDNVVKLGMNAVIVQVRPFADAFYPSSYFPWSKYVSGEQGKNPGYDPLEYMVKAAHSRGLQFHAWINPYRITSSTTDITTLSKNHPARKYLEDKNKANDRYVLSYGGKLYFNPAYAAVRTLIVNGVKEIVDNYDVDGIHFDDYFYPTMGSKYETVFDAPEYESYKKKQLAAGEDYKDIVSWRKWQVSSLVYRVYETVKSADPHMVFGISPEGFLDSLLMPDRHYIDLKSWFTKKGFIDYICPQLYFSFEHKVAPFGSLLTQWIEYMGKTNVKLYVGIPVYKAGSKEEEQFRNDTKILQKMIEACRDTGKVSGFAYYRYEYFYSKTAKKAVDNLLAIINE